VQAIDHGDGRIVIHTGYDSEDDRIFLEVRDNGRGIAPSIENKIFDPFVTDRLHEGGTGLGLAVTYSLTKAHDGDIRFESRAKHGTVFKVSFPPKRKTRGARILIVDDEKWNRELLMTTLTRERDYMVDEAANGVEACIKLGSYRPDMLILDMFMPHMDGLEVCRTIRNTPELAGMVVLLTTGFPGHPKLDEAADLGFTNVFFKPIKMEDLLRKVDALLSPGI
jgi:CheY-like chemotaxis protein